ncbi:MAG: beta-lactamase family protein [Candidatus Aminicenantes bacterium]|nr:beta-lactamase family protein [Candidatus Aminicenantes bacterium]
MDRLSQARKVFLSLIFTFISLSLVLANQSGPEDKTKEVDKLFAALDKTTSPGAALAIIKDGEIIYTRGYGMAKLEDDLVMTPSKIFDIGSVSKQFTATCIAILALEGKLSLDDDVRKYIPELPTYERPITIRHLLHHTSGLRDYNALLSLAGFRPDSDCPTVEESLEIICRQKKLNHPPGEEYSYTNTGYFLLGLIVERVSGKSLNQFAQERIFRPLDMKNTFFQDNHNQIIKNRASGYSPEGDGFRLNLSNWDEVGDGNVYTTVEDLYLWDQAFYNHRLGRQLMELLHTQGILNNGQKIDYAFGLIIGHYRGLKTISHSGSWAGFRASLIRFPDEKFSIICLSNLSTFNPAAVSYKIADIYLADKFKEEIKKEKLQEFKPYPLTEKELQEKCGNYKEIKFSQWLTISLEKDNLKASIGRQQLVLTPLGPTSFQTLLGDSLVRFEFGRDEKGQISLSVTGIGREKYTFIKAAPLPPFSPAALKEYEGFYQSYELLGAIYQIILDKENNLKIKFRNAPKEPLKAMAPDEFTAEGLNFTFLRGKNKKVNSLALSVGRAANIMFRKLEKNEAPRFP